MAKDITDNNAADFSSNTILMREVQPDDRIRRAISQQSASQDILVDDKRAISDAQEKGSLGGDLKERLSPGEDSGSVTENIKAGGGLNKWVERRWVWAVYGMMFLAGWSDASTGPLLLRIQDNYNLSYPVVSLIFISGFIGFFTAAAVNVWVVDYIGFGWGVLGAAGCQVVAFAIQAGRPPFPVFLLTFIPNGLGMGLQDANANAFITHLPGASQKMALIHAMYGFGAFVTPLVATQFAREDMKSRWNFHYLCSLSIATVNFLVIIFIFRGKREERLFDEQDYVPVQEGVEMMPTALVANEAGATVEEVVVVPDDSKTKMKRILKSPFVHLVALFSWIYVGIEVTIGGWAVTYIVEVRGGGESSGYVSSGFFGGLTVGRILQIGVSRYISEQNIVFIYTAIALALVMVIWQVPGVVGNAVAYAFLGLVLGPIYPIMMNATAAMLEPDLAGGAIGYIAALGQCGSALFPWITGALAGRYGVWALQPLLLAMIVLNGTLWAGVVWMSRRKWKRSHKF